jgi:hypothetical protein
MHTRFAANVIQEIKSSTMRCAGYAVCMGDRRGLYRVLEGRPDGKIPLEGPRHRGR